MDAKDILHIAANLARLIGEDDLVKGMESIGWRGIEDHPVAFIKGYMEEYVDHKDYQVAIDGMKLDLTRIADSHGYALEGDEFVQIFDR